MILVETSIWTDHIRSADPQLEALLQSGNLVMHPLVIAELAMGSLPKRATTLRMLERLEPTPLAATREVRLLIETRRLYGRGIGFVDASLLASCLLRPRSQLWTRDRRLAAVAAELGVGYTAGRPS